MWNSNVVGRRALRFLLLVCILAIFPAGKRVAVAENKQKSAKSLAIKRKSSGPYCGMYCLYTVMRLADKEVDFRKLLKPEYIGSRKGSSLAELKKAAKDNGLYALPMGKLTSQVLRICPHPVILHVKPGTTSKIYDHYELFLGTNSGQARLFDPPEPIRLVPFRELAPLWDGNGLIVSAESIDPGAIVAPARKRFILFAAIALIIILIVRWAKRRLPEAMLNSRSKLFGLSVGQGLARSKPPLRSMTTAHLPSVSSHVK